MLWVRILIRARCTVLCDKVLRWLATCQWFSPGPLVSSTNKADCHDITEIVLNTIKQKTNKNKSKIEIESRKTFDSNIENWNIWSSRKCFDSITETEVYMQVESFLYSNIENWNIYSSRKCFDFTIENETYVEENLCHVTRYINNRCINVGI